MNRCENPPDAHGSGRSEPKMADFAPPVNALSGSVWLGLALNTALYRLSAGVRRRREIRRLRSWFAMESAEPGLAETAQRPDRLS